MAKKNFTPEQIINKLREAEVHINHGISIAEASQKHPVSNTMANHHSQKLLRL